MNWLTKIKDILGSFWNLVFSDTNFTLGVENVESLLGQKQQAAHDAWAAGSVAADRTLYDDKMPYTVYLLKSMMVTDAEGNTSMQDCVVHPAVSFDDIFADEDPASLDDRDPHGGWVVQSRFDIPVPHHLTDHVLGYSRTMFNGVDYDWVDGAFKFYFDPATLQLPEVPIMGSDNVLRVYWRLFGWTAPELAIKDMVAAFEDISLNQWADTVWDIHQNGANYYNIRKLLGGVTGAVICRADGVVDDIWTEQGSQCMLVGSAVYTAPVGMTCNYSVGDNVKLGDVLFGDMRMFASADIPDAGLSQADVPGIRVMTDVGDLVAQNDDMAAITVDGTSIIPLTEGYSDDTPQSYIDKCLANSGNANCTQYVIPDPVNPFMFVMKNMRRGCGVLSSLVVDATMPVSAALECIRKSVNASGMITMYLQASGDTVDTDASFTADAGNAAVAVDATVTVQEMFAEAEIVL